MEDTKKAPIVFANQVIRQLVDHSVGSEMPVTSNDFTTMRTVFRRYGGNWEQFWHGDPVQQKLLKSVVTSWVQMPGRKPE